MALQVFNNLSLTGSFFSLENYDFFNRQMNYIYNVMSSKNEALHQLFEGKRLRNEVFAKEFSNKAVVKIIGMEAPATLDKPYSEATLERIFRKAVLNAEHGITFSNDRISRQKITDGLCSSIAFTTLRYILTSSESMPQRLERIAKDFQNGAPQEVAIAQAVFNSIDFTGDLLVDKRLAKMQSLANLFDLSLDPYPVIFKFENKKENKKFLMDLENQIKALKPGNYCIRTIWNEDGMETVGHSLVFVKGPTSYLFDTGFALLSLDSRNMVETLTQSFDIWGEGKFDELRFYKVSLKPAMVHSNINRVIYGN